MNFIIELLRQYPPLALFITVGLGFLLGRLKYKNFSLGPVTSVLIIGVLIGQLDIPLSSDLKTVFFMMFLFSIGYSVGPQFFRSLKGMGLKMVAFAILMSSTCFLAVYLMSRWLSYNAGETVGFFSGSQTCSALLAVGGDAINNSAAEASAKQAMINIMPVCYAVTYVFGTLGTVILLGTFGPSLLGGLQRVKDQTRELEAQMNEATWKSDPVNISALRTVAFRTFKVEQPYFAGGRSVATVEHFLRATGRVLYVDRIRRADGEIEVAEKDSMLRQGDTVVICGRREYLMVHTGYFGPEVNDPELLEYPVERIPVLVVSKDVAGKTVDKLRDLPEMRGVMIEEIQRGEEQMDVEPDQVIARGDTLVLVGRRSNLRKVSRMIGYIDVPTDKSDIAFIGLAIFIGAFLGAIPIVVKGIPMSFGLSGGSLIAGLVFGWLRTRRPTFGYIPPAALWLMNNLGLNVFIAVVGINAAPTFVSGIRSVGFGLLGAGALATLIPLCVGLLLGRFVFKFNPAITLGCCAGTRTCTAALGAVQETLGSNIPTMGYTVTYAVSNILLVIWGVVTVALG